MIFYALTSKEFLSPKFKFHFNRPMQINLQEHKRFKGEVRVGDDRLGGGKIQV